MVSRFPLLGVPPGQPRFRDEGDVSKLQPARFHRFPEALVVRIADVRGAGSICG